MKFPTETKSPSLSITFETTTKDLHALYRHARKISPEHRRSQWILGGMAALIAALSSQTTNQENSVTVEVLTFLILFGAIWLFMLILSQLLFHLNIAFLPNRKGMKGVLCKHTITIDPEGFTEETDVNQSRSTWKGLYRVDSTPSYLFLYIQPNQAHVIPRSSFASMEEAEIFLQTAQKYHQTEVSGLSLT